MERKRKEIIFPILVILSTAILFFAIGYLACSIYGPAYVIQNKMAQETVASIAVSTDVSSTTIVPITSDDASDTTITTISSATTTTPSVSTTENTTASTTVSTTVSTTATTSTPTIAGKINLNTATKEELMTVPGIGEVYAERIIQHREDFGPFTSLDQLLEISGIGEKRFNKWVVYFTI